jgi:hypothetical protein
MDCQSVGGPKDGAAWGAGLQHPQSEVKKKHTHTGFVHMMISQFVRDLPVSLDQPLKSADDLYILTLDKAIKLICR